jgi:hypothetical protein
VKATWWCLVLAGLAGGCMPATQMRDATAPPTNAAAAPARPIRVVTADQVNEANVYLMLQLFDQELESAAQAPCPVATDEWAPHKTN